MKPSEILLKVSDLETECRQILKDGALCGYFNETMKGLNYLKKQLESELVEVMKAERSVKDWD